MSIAYGRFCTATGAVIFGAGADTAQQHVQSTLLGNKGNDFADAVNAKTIITWGGNPAEAYVHAWQYVCQARENGAKLITIDPQFTATAAHSDTYRPHSPPAPMALLTLAMANYIRRERTWRTTAFSVRSSTVAPFLVKDDGTYLRMSDYRRRALPKARYESHEPAMPTVDRSGCRVGMRPQERQGAASRTPSDPAIAGCVRRFPTVRRVPDRATRRLMDQHQAITPIAKAAGHLRRCQPRARSRSLRASLRHGGP